MKVYVIRHGQTELNKLGIINGHLDAPLAEEGIKQAKLAAETLPKKIKHIYVSSLERAKQTAEILNDVLKVPMTFHDELREVNFGVLNGTPFLDEHMKCFKMLNYDWRPSGESYEDVKTRVLKILNTINNENGDSEALIVAHGGIVILMHFLETGEYLDDVGNASIRSFDLDKILK